jgi:hypothetical protein
VATAEYVPHVFEVTDTLAIETPSILISITGHTPEASDPNATTVKEYDPDSGNVTDSSIYPPLQIFHPLVMAWPVVFTDIFSASRVVGTVKEVVGGGVVGVVAVVLTKTALVFADSPPRAFTADT